ncbi:S24 family peptidase [Candidatus Sodalis endolongispinus]|uniref:S24 family peptidase n=1 Tax=Candidatus Sodalis endolongispinus TaxID=2812662 RepID=A0ABS5Y8A0_9GAMM|nr:S24 family peptidase [Candidatus Sodalis endolongispinus]MBT9431236.1 S24 family peptidase [Candidatus Sodalis endolongispinus]
MNERPSALANNGHRVLLETLYYGEANATYLMRACEASATCGIRAGALLVIDPEAKPQDGSIVVIQNGEDLSLRRLRQRPEKYLENLDAPDDILLWHDDDSAPSGIICWGLLIYIVNGESTR